MPLPDQPAAAPVDELLAALWEAGGTDLHLTVGLPPQLRIHGELSAVPGSLPLTTEDLDAAIRELVSPIQRAAHVAGTELDFSLDICNQVIEVFEPTPERNVIINLPATV